MSLVRSKKTFGSLALVLPGVAIMVHCASNPHHTQNTASSSPPPEPSLAGSYSGPDRTTVTITTPHPQPEHTAEAVGRVEVSEVTHITVSAEHADGGADAMMHDAEAHDVVEHEHDAGAHDAAMSDAATSDAATTAAEAPTESVHITLIDSSGGPPCTFEALGGHRSFTLTAGQTCTNTHGPTTLTLTVANGTATFADNGITLDFSGAIHIETAHGAHHQHVEGTTTYHIAGQLQASGAPDGGTEDAGGDASEHHDAAVEDAAVAHDAEADAGHETAVHDAGARHGHH